MNAITPAGAFGLYGGLTAFWYILIVFCFPEISGMSLEEVRMILSSGFGVRKSLRLRREKLALWKEEKRTAEQLAALQNGTDMPSAV